MNTKIQLFVRELLIPEQIQLLPSDTSSIPNYGSMSVLDDTDIETETGPVRAESTECISCLFNLVLRRLFFVIAYLLLVSASFGFAYGFFYLCIALIKIM